MLQDQDSVMESQMDSILILMTPTNTITVQEAKLTRITAVQALCLMTAVSAVFGPKGPPSKTSANSEIAQMTQPAIVSCS